MKNFFDGKKALVVINPISGKRTTKSQLFDIADLFSTGGLETTVYTTRARGDAVEIVRRRGEEFDIVVCRGGDGTFHEVVNGMMRFERKPLLGYIPAGSTNDLARTLYIPINSNKEAIEVILNGQPLWNDVGLFNGETHFVYTACFGAFTDVAYDTPQSLKNKLGRGAYFVKLPTYARKIRPLRTIIKTAEGYEFDGDLLICGVTNATSLAGIAKFSRKDVGLNDGRFELILLKYPRTPAQFAQILERIVTRDYTHEDAYMLHTSGAEFTFPDVQPAWTLDGEAAGAHERVVIENIHNAIRIFRR